LFGQIDVKGSSETRNEATRQDLSLQLSLAKQIVETQFKIEKLPAYEQLIHQFEFFLEGLNYRIQVDTEQEIVSFFSKEIHPLFEFLQLKNKKLSADIANYFSQVDEGLNLIYYYRKNYDDTISLINKNMSHVIDQKQEEAQ